MIGALTAETMKLVRHRATWALVWIFPIGLTLLFLLGLALRLSHGLSPRGGFALSADLWIASTTVIWKVASSGPGRFLIGAFAALAFGGEYGWNTWKLVVPHSRRIVLIAAKYVVVLGLLLASLALTALLSVAFSAISSAANGDGMPEGITAAALLAAHGKAALVTLISALLSIGYASAAAILIRSTLGGAIVAVAAVVAEGIAGAFAPLLNPTLFLTLPTYHLRNLESWIVSGTAAMQPLPSGLVHDPWMVSLACLAAWIVVLFGIAAVVFERQDLN